MNFYPFDVDGGLKVALGAEEFRDRALLEREDARSTVKGRRVLERAFTHVTGSV